MAVIFSVILACWWCLFFKPYSLWVALMPYNNFSPLTMPILGSTVCAWSCCNFKLLLMSDLWFFREWVMVLPCYNSHLLMMPNLGSLVCKCLWYFSVSLTCWWWLFLNPQLVSCCSTLLQFWPADDAIFGSSACEWLSCLSLILTC